MVNRQDQRSAEFAKKTLTSLKSLLPVGRATTNLRSKMPL